MSRGKHARPSLFARIKARRERNRQAILITVRRARIQRQLDSMLRAVSNDVTAR